MIHQHFIEKAKAQADIVQIIGEYVDLKKTGSNFIGLSPFTNEKTPSFVVSPSKQRFNCYSSNQSGDVIAFLQLTQNLTFYEAVKLLASKLSLDVEYADTETTKKHLEQRAQVEEYRQVLKAAFRIYQQLLLSQPTNHPAWLELSRRGYTREDVTEYSIGYAPGGMTLHDAIKGKAGETALLANAEAIGLINNLQNDKYYHRLVYAIYDRNNQIVGLAGRALDENNRAKWINPIDSPLYNKSELFFGLHAAIDSITRWKEIILVEGYNDVISFHKHGATNTIATSGTSLSDWQLKTLVRFHSRILLAHDNDKAGIKSKKRLIPVLLANDLHVSVLLLDDKDPDDFTRSEFFLYSEQALPDLLQEDDLRIDGFVWLCRNSLSDNDLENADGLKFLIQTLAKINDPFKRDAYLKILKRESKQSLSQLKKWLEEVNVDLVDEEPVEDESSLPPFQKYILPREVTTEIDDLLEDIERYGIFMSDHRIYSRRGDGAPYYFERIANFDIEILQHMSDEKYPQKLIRITNERNQTIIFACPSDSLNQPTSFDKTVSDQGNYMFNGNRKDLIALRSKLQNEMGVGQSMEVLGWQPNLSLWLWNNRVFKPEHGVIPMDENGIFKYEDYSYYMPSSNKAYARNDHRYIPQKSLVYLQSKINFKEYAQQLYRVHRGHAINGLLFTIGTMFLDHVVDAIGNFPLIFLYGPPSTGKDQLIMSCQSFFGKPQTAINIGANVSTTKAQIRKSAQFRNIILHLSEYRAGDPKRNELLKQFWDRRGYEIGTLESKFATDTIPVTSSVIYTGNEYPDDDALISRSIWEEMTKTDFNENDKREYQRLQDMFSAGISSITEEILQYRSMFEQSFKSTFRVKENVVKNAFKDTVTQDRIISNISVLASVYELFHPHLSFPFTFKEFIEHNQQCVNNQAHKISTGSIVTRFWEAFVYTVRLKNDGLILDQDFIIDGDTLTFRWNLVYLKISRHWFQLYHQAPPAKSSVYDMLRDHHSYVTAHKSIRFPDKSNSSAHTIDLNHLYIKQDLINAIQWTSPSTVPNELINTQSPATPKEKPSAPDDPNSLPF